MPTISHYALMLAIGMSLRSTHGVRIHVAISSRTCCIVAATFSAAAKLPFNPSSVKSHSHAFPTSVYWNPCIAWGR